MKPVNRHEPSGAASEGDSPLGDRVYVIEHHTGWSNAPEVKELVAAAEEACKMLEDVAGEVDADPAPETVRLRAALKAMR